MLYDVVVLPQLSAAERIPVSVKVIMTENLTLIHSEFVHVTSLRDPFVIRGNVYGRT